MTHFGLDYCRLMAEIPTRDRSRTCPVQWSFVAGMLKLSRASAVDERVLETP